jgi:hypothetical protein
VKNFREIAEDAAKKLRADSKNDDMAEFLAWLDVALKREAMVSVIYRDDRVKKHLDAWAEEFKVAEPVKEIIMTALLDVWAQEEAHQSYFKTMLRGIKSDAKTESKVGLLLTKIRGQVEGMAVESLVGRSEFKRFCARVAIILGQTTEDVPSYVKDLHEKQFSEYCSINADLEHTAVKGYSRMLELGNGLLDRSVFTSTTLIYALQDTKKQEMYHEALFERLAGWPPDPPDDVTGPDISPFPSVSAGEPIMTEADAQKIILQAKQHVYGAQHAHLASQIIEVNEWKIFNDPIVVMLRAYANHEDVSQYELGPKMDTRGKLDQDVHVDRAARVEPGTLAAEPARADLQGNADQPARAYSSAEFGEIAQQKDDDEEQENYMTAEN